MLGISSRYSQRGFTIVELLIVVVVIAILAAITLVAFNGVTNRAKASAAQSSAKQALTKLQAYAITNEDRYPDTLDAIGLATSSNETSYQYRVDNSTSPSTFCITATSNSISYYTSHTGAAPTAGACLGHGANGAAATTNLIPNPRMIQSGTLIAMGVRYGWGRIFPSTEDGPSGIPTYLRSTVGTGSVGTNRGIDWFVNPDTTLSGAANERMLPVTAGETYTLSAWVRTSRTANVGIGYRIHNGMTWLNAYTQPGVVSVPQGQWTRVSATIPITLTGYLAARNGVSSTGWTSTDTFDQTGLMITKTNTLLPYADGTFAGWIWNGGANQASSSGPIPQ